MKEPKIEIPCLNEGLRCKDICKINKSTIDNDKNLLVMEWICDCGYMSQQPMTEVIGM